MKKILLIPVLFLLVFGLFAQIEQQEVTVTNIVVPVRIYSNNTFVDSLKIEDFELLEDGIQQNIEALYLINQTDVARKETAKEFSPQLSRHFYFIFQISEYDPKFKETVDYFFNSVLLPGDRLTLMTPMGNYSLSRKALKIKSKESLSKDMQSVIRKDATVGAAAYRSMITDLTRLIRSISSAGSVDPQSSMVSNTETSSSSSGFGSDNIGFLLGAYRATLENLEGLRVVDETKLIRFAQSLKRQPGRKNVFFFYEREFRPEINDRILGQMMDRYQDEQNIIGDLMDLFQFYQRHTTLNIEKIAQTFADAALQFNFIFINRNAGNVTGVTMREQSEDVFNAFSQFARATGGVVDNSQNPAAAFANAYKIAGSYYLLYYTPADYQEDGSFKKIQVRVKNQDYTITHRYGYFSR
jgi:VWFA-related protein